MKLLFILILILISSICYAEPYRIALVSSYGPLHDCGSPQVKGFVDFIKDHLPSDTILRTYYLNSLQNQSKPIKFGGIIRSTNKRIISFDPDYIVVFDDIAFRSIGIDKWLDKKPILFSGVNGTPESFDGIFTIDGGVVSSNKQIMGVFENTEWLHFLDTIVDKSHNRIDTLYLLVDDTKVSKIIEKAIISEFKSRNRMIKLEVVYISNVSDLITFISTNKMKHDIVYVMLRNIRYRVSGDVVGTERVLQIIEEYNRKLIITTINGYLSCKYGSYGTSIDFYEMGEQVSNILFDYIHSNPSPRIINNIEPINYVNEYNSRITDNMINFKSLEGFKVCQ